jgi:transcriptional regulator with XRE-family HTH domain
MRCRRGLSQGEVAEHLRVRQSAISHWEQSRAAPAADRLEALLDLLGAYPEERAAMRDARLLAGTPAHGSQLSVESLEAELAALKRDVDRGNNALMDLRLLVQEARIWPLARRSEAAQCLLLDTYRTHSRWLWWRERNQEAFGYAEQILRTIPLSSPCPVLTELQIDAVHIQVGVATDRGSPSARQSAREQLRRWLPRATRPAEKVILYRDMADNLGRDADFKGAMDFCARATEMGISAEQPRLIELSRFTAANALTRAGRPGEALGLLRTEGVKIPIENVNEALLWSTALIALGDRSEAGRWLSRANSLIATNDLAHFRHRASRLASCL